jgi:hypothetical protein
MRDSVSLHSLIYSALNDQEGRSLNPNLISLSVNDHYFHEASKLVLREYPSEVPLSRLVADRLQKEVRLNSNDFFTFIFVVLLKLQRPDNILGLLFLSEISVSNYQYAIMLAIFEIVLGITEVHPDYLNEYFIANNKGFLSTYALTKHLSLTFEERIRRDGLKKNRPAPEFLRQGDRIAFSKLIGQLNDLCTTFYNDPTQITAFSTGLSQALSDSRQLFTDVKKMFSEHVISMLARRDLKNMLDEIREGASSVVANYVEKAIQDGRPFGVLMDIRDSLSTGLSFAKACFLAEAYGLIHRKVKSSGKPDQAAVDSKRLVDFAAAVTRFTQDFQTSSVAKSVSTVCLTYPKARDESIRNAATATAKTLIELNRVITYMKYLLTASALNAIYVAERIDYLRYATGDQTLPSPAAEIEAFTARYAALLQVRQHIATIFSKFKEPYLVYDVKTLVFDENFRKWGFPVELGLGDVAPDVLESLLEQRVDACQRVTETVMGLKLKRLCPHCKKLDRQLICEKCEGFAVCRRCRSRGCAQCGSPFPDA